MHAVGGTEDHVHLVPSVPPSLWLSEIVRQVKGSSSLLVNHKWGWANSFAWQSEHGVQSIDNERLDQIVKRVRRQKQRHQSGSTNPALEIAAARDEAR